VILNPADLLCEGSAGSSCLPDPIETGKLVHTRFSPMRHRGRRKGMERSRDWFSQAQRDLESARHLKQGGFHEWASFASQQAAEKALKAVYQYLGGDAWGHSCYRLLQGLQERCHIEEGLLEAARALDRFYIPARYPNGWDSGAPKDFIGEKDSSEAIGFAEEILRFCQGILA